MEKLNIDEFDIAHNLLNQIKNQTVLMTIMTGETPGVIYVNKKKTPDLAYAQFKHRAFLSGEPSTDDYELLRNFFDINVRKYCQAFDVPLFRLTVSDPRIFDIIFKVLEPLEPIVTGYHCYQKLIIGNNQDFIIPEGYKIIPVNGELINSAFPGREDLLEEMCSERESLKAFLEKSFGVAAFKEDALAGWCLSEYNHEDQCEVGIATMPPHRRIGLAKAMTGVFSNQAFEKGITKILWHCFESNLPSWRTALSAGFTLAESDEVLILYWDPALNQAVHGNINFEQGKYDKALTWYEKALSQEAPESWMAFNAACVSAHLDQPDMAFTYLISAIDLGFDNLDYLVANKHLASLKVDPKWGEIITRINRKLQSKP